MKYSVVMGNPPYTLAARGDGTGSTSIYPEFFFMTNGVGIFSSVISPARWFNSPKGELRTARKMIQEAGLTFLQLHFSGEQVFPNAEVLGGLSWYLNRIGGSAETEFFRDGGWVKRAPQFDGEGMISLDEISEIRTILSEHPEPPNAVQKWTAQWQFLKLSGRKDEMRSNEDFFQNSNSTRSKDTDVRIRMTDGSWRYFSESIMDPESYVPEGKFALSFSIFWRNEAPTANARTLILFERESAKASTPFFFDRLDQVGNFYKYSRTKFFGALCRPRLSSFMASPYTYKDIPMFSFTESDPIDWSLSIPEIDNQLIAHFGLEDYREYILSASKPYARALGQEYLDRLSGANVDTSGINEWYA